MTIVESPPDVVWCWQFGIKNVVATMGAQVSWRQIDLIRKYADEVVLALDNDHAGQGAAKKLAKQLVGMPLFFLMMPVGKKDLGECSREEVKEAFAGIEPLTPRF